MLGARLTHGQPGSLRLVGAPVWAIRWPSGVIRPSDVRVALAPDRPAGPFAALHSIQPANRPEDPPTGLANRRRATVSAVALSRCRAIVRAVGPSVAPSHWPACRGPASSRRWAHSNYGGRFRCSPLPSGLAFRPTRTLPPLFVGRADK